MFQHPVPPAFLAAIGDVTVSFSSVEHVLGMLVWSMFTDHQRVGQIVTAELAFRAKRALLVSLYVERHGKDDDFANLKTLMKRAEQLEARRNVITHSMWGAGPDAGRIYRFKQVAKERSGWGNNSEVLTLSDIGQVAADLRALASDLMAFYIALIGGQKANANPIARIWPSSAGEPTGGGDGDE